MKTEISRAAQFCLAAAFGFGACGFAFADDSVLQERNVTGISDNSFFIEEAYNQEAGIVQHILTLYGAKERASGPDDELWELAFTQEWPLFSQTHQVSYSVPYQWFRSGGGCKNGIGDVSLNYRYQAYFNEETLTAFAPNAGVVLPTGDEDRGLGEDTVGFELGLPFSTTLGDNWFAHLNAGLSFLPDASSADDRDLLHFGVGASAIYAMTRSTHLLVEWIGEWEHGLNSSGNRRYEFASFISPGVRKAFNLAGGPQFVIGAAVPIGLTDSAPDYGVFLYFSFEHAFSRSTSD